MTRAIFLATLATATLAFGLVSACSVERVEIERPKEKTPDKPVTKSKDPPPLKGKKNVDELGHKLVEVDSQSGFREIESRGLQLFALGRLDEVIKLLEPHASDKDNLGAQRLLAMTYLRQGDGEKAKSHVEMYNAHPGAVPQVKAEFQRRIDRLQAGAKGTFNHAPLTSILEKAVKTKPSGNTEVDYNVVVSRAGDLEAYLRAIGDADAGALSDLEKMAFYTNAYNAWTLQAVLNNKLHAAGAKVKSVQGVPGFFDKKRFPIAGEQLTLNELEERKLRPPNGPAEVHFVVNCASVSCPPLRAKAYTGADIGKSLVEQTTSYIKRDVTVKGKTIEVVKLFDWYKKDFGGDKGVREFLVKYGVKEAADPSMKIVFKTYDWRLNKVR